MTRIDIPARDVRVAPQAAPPTYFLSLTLRNIRCFGDQDVTLDMSTYDGLPSQWTIIVGENGVGKTTLLQCLVLLQPDIPERAEDPEAALPEFQPLFAGSFYQVSTLFRRSYGNRKVAPDNAEQPRISISATLYTGGLLKDQLATTGHQVVEHYGFHEGRIIHYVESTKSNISALSPYGYGASRRMGEASLSGGHNTATDTSSLFGDSPLRNAEEWLLQADYALKTTPSDFARLRLSSVTSLLTELLPEVSDFRFTTSNDSSMTPVVEALTPYGWVRVRDLSLGYKTALTWIVDLASRMLERYPKSDKPLEEPAIVLVDEIDLHLHPRWQRELLHLLSETFPNTQFIVTAHSPLVVQAAPDANIALLRRNGDHVEIVNDVDEIRNWRVDQILTSDLFGLESSRSTEVEKLLEERTRLATKSRQTAKDRERIAEIDAELDEKPLGESAAERRAMDALQHAAELLREA